MEVRGVGLAWLLAMSCAPTAPAPAPRPSSAPSARTAATDGPGAPPPDAAGLVPRAPYRLLWSNKSKESLRLLAVAPWGDVVTVDNDGTLELLAGHDGGSLATVKAPCSRADALEFVDHDAAIMLCDRQVVEVRFPGPTVRSQATAHGRLDHAAIRSTALAVATGVRVRVMERGSQRVLLDAEQPDSVRLVALSADGSRVAAHVHDHGLVIYDVPTQTRLVQSPREVRTMAFSADGSALVVGNDEGAAVLDAATGAPRRTLAPTGSGWLDGAMFLTPDLLLLSTDDSLHLVPKTTKAQTLTNKDLNVGWRVAASPDASLVCAIGRWREIACFGTRPPEPSGYPATARGLGKTRSADALANALCAASAACVGAGLCHASAHGGCTADSASCRKSAACRMLGQCTAERGMCVASEASCRAAPGCNLGGLCDVYQGQCVLDDAACRRAAACRERGQCTSNGGTCEVGSEHDCYQSLDCLEKALCTRDGDRCVIASDDDCRRSRECLGGPSWSQGGRCTFKEGRCVLGDDFGCRRSPKCRERGECSFDNDECVAMSADDCKSSKRCKERGLCSLHTPGTGGGECAALTADDCASTAACKEEGACIAAERGCAKSCNHPLVCQIYGLCVQQGMRCVATPTSCQRARVCKREQRCRVSTEGTCVR